eukprot:1008362-Amorphochlora_amoeboformis.AAC.4
MSDEGAGRIEGLVREFVESRRHSDWMREERIGESSRKAREKIMKESAEKMRDPSEVWRVLAMQLRF